jgi:GT2 family glycosyltransferase
VAAVGAAVDARVAAGRDRLGVSVPLRGMGMAFRRSLLERVPWDAFGVAEDAEYDRRLRRTGVRVRYCRDAVVTTTAPNTITDLVGQRRRWRAALRVRRVLDSKPLVLLHLALAAGLCLATGTFIARGAALVALTSAIYLRALIDVGCTWKRPGRLAGAPLVVLRLAWIALIGGLRPKLEWTRTPR